MVARKNSVRDLEQLCTVLQFGPRLEISGTPIRECRDLGRWTTHSCLTLPQLEVGRETEKVFKTIYMQFYTERAYSHEELLRIVHWELLSISLELKFWKLRKP